MRFWLSFRTRIILLVLGVALVPLGLVGWWLTRAAARSGEALLRGRLEETLERTVADIGPRWIAQRSALLTLAEHDAVQRALAGDPVPQAAVPAALTRLFAAVDPAVEGATIRLRSGRVLWTLQRRDSGVVGESMAGTPLVVRLDVFERLSGRALGVLEARVRASSFLPSRPGATFVGGAVLAVLDPESGASLVSTPFDPANLLTGHFLWAGDRWITSHRSLADPRLDPVAAAPLDPFTEPFERASSRGLWLLVVVATTGVLFATLITARMTGRLRRLAAAADSVAAGDLVRKGMSPDVLARVREAFFSTKADGTGLGLAIAERIVRAHGGEMEIESAVGNGTVVRVSFPVVPPL